MSMDILLVEDNPADVRLVQEALREHELLPQLHWVASGDAALRFLRQDGEHAGSPTPDLVLLDLNLPGLNGQEVLALIKQDSSLRQIPVVVLTSSAAKDGVLQAYGSHANAYMVKPNDFEAYKSLVRAIHDYWCQSVLLPGRLG